MKKYDVTTVCYDGNSKKVGVSYEVYLVIKETDRETASQDRQIRRRHIQLDYAWNDFEIPLIESPEAIYISTLEREEAEQEKKKLSDKIYAVLDTCTPKQKERFLLWAVKGMTYREIAGIENIRHKAVQDSVAQVIKKIKNFFEKH